MNTRILTLLPLLLIAILPIGAQTGGATAPEATQFEPVDMTDLVDLKTGDFTYALPAVTIPGAPGGAYPIALQYHAGILYDQEASWVGLGWNLSPGSVSRIIRGYPDDYKGAPISSYTDFPILHSNSIGIGIAGFSVGAQWDNHGGFGGNVGYSFSVGNMNIGVNRSFYKSAEGSTGGYSISPSYGFNNGATVGLRLSDTGVDASVGFRTGGGQSLSLSTSGSASYSTGRYGSSGSMRIWGPSQRSSVMSNTESTNFSLNFGVFSLSSGHSTTKSYTYQNSYAWGYLHLGQFGQTVRDLENNDIENLNAFELEELDIISAKRTAFDLDRPFMPQTPQFSQRHLALDTYYQDFASNFHEFDEYSHLKKTFESDYQTGNYDGFSVAAQGLSGIAKPVSSQRGFLMPNDRVFSKEIAPVPYGDPDSDFFFHPYRNLMYALENGLTEFPELAGQLQGAHPFWEQNMENMVFLDDPGLREKSNFFNDPDLPGLHRIENRSKTIRYEMGEKGNIELIVVTKPDGLRYYFGNLKGKEGSGIDGLVTAGAAPRITGESRYSKKSRLADGSLPTITRETFHEPYAYTWYLAAVVSPDFVDNAPKGHFGPEDFGDYITFHYDRANARYQWVYPMSDFGSDPSEFALDPLVEDPQNNDEVFAYSGKSINEDAYFFERSKGNKELYFPSEARTRTHMATFDRGTGTNRRKDNLSAEYAVSESSHLEFLNGLDFRLAQDALTGASLNMVNDLTTGIESDFVFAFPAGAAHRLGLRLAHPTSSDQLQVEAFYCYLDELDRPRVTSTNLTLKYYGTLTLANQEVFAIISDVTTITSCPTVPRIIKIHVPLSAGGNLGDGGAERLTSIRVFNKRDLDPVFDSLATGLFDPRIIDDPEYSDQYQIKTAFEQDYSLAPNTPNSNAALKGRLTLNGVTFYSRGEVLGNQGYQFDYYKNPQRQYTEYYGKDPWGYFSGTSGPVSSKVDPSYLYANPNDPNLDDWDREAPVQAIWSLKSLTTPMGTKLTLGYESDRYTLVQDRFAATVDINHPNRKGLIINTMDRYIGNEEVGQIIQLLYEEPIQDRELKSTAEIIADLSQIQMGLPITPISHTQILLTAIFSLDSAVNVKARFVLPIAEGTNGLQFIPNHPGLEEFVRWAWHVENLDVGQINFLEFGGIFVDSNGLPLETDYYGPDNQNRLVGALGGGLRVKTVEFAPSSGIAAPEETFRTVYAYDQINADSLNPGMDSGVIFSDPPRYKTGVDEDLRIVRGELNPYLHMPGSEVIYGSVGVKTIQEGLQTATTRYRFHTASNKKVLYPFRGADDLGTMTRQENISFEEQDIRYTVGYEDGNDDPRERMYKWKRLNSEKWEVQPINIANHPQNTIDFQLHNQSKMTLVNNSAFIGLLDHKVTFDDQGRLLASTHNDYGPVYNTLAPLEGPVLKGYKMENGRLNPELFGGSEGQPFTRAHHPGVVNEKSQSLLISASHDGFNYGVAVKLMEETYNTFHLNSQILKEYHYDSDGVPSHELENTTQFLARDFYSGEPIITSTHTKNGNGTDLYQYSLEIPAHQLHQDDRHVVGGQDYNLRAMNMLSQPGFALTAVSSTNLNASVQGPFLDRLEQSQVIGATQSHWRRLPSPDPGRLGSWVADASFQFVHPDSSKTGKGWRQLETQQDQNLIQLEVATGDGDWFAAGQNTLYDRKLNVLEYRDRRDNFSAAVYDPSGRLLRATFGNAQQSQVFYEGFEDAPAGTSTVVVNANFVEGNDFQGGSLSPDGYRANFQSVYAGQRAHQGNLTLTGLAPFNSYAANGIQDNRGTYWVSYYVKHSASIQVLGQSLTLEAHSDDGAGIWITPVDNDWYLVRFLTNNPTDLTLDAGSGGTIDEITVYPAASLGPVGARKSTGHTSIIAYHPHHEKVISITDARGRTLRYEYNGKGELFRTYDIDGKLKTANFRSYRGQKLDGNPGSAP